MDKVLTLLGFASKSGALCFGAFKTTEAVKRGRAKCVLIAEDISDKSRKETLFYCEKYGALAYVLKGVNIEALSHAVGVKCGVVAVTGETFKNPIISNLTSDI